MHNQLQKIVDWGSITKMVWFAEEAQEWQNSQNTEGGICYARKVKGYS